MNRHRGFLSLPILFILKSSSSCLIVVKNLIPPPGLCYSCWTFQDERSKKKIALEEGILKSSMHPAPPPPAAGIFLSSFNSQTEISFSCKTEVTLDS